MLWGSGAGLLFVSSSLWCAATRHSVLGGPCQQACCSAIGPNVAKGCGLAVVICDNGVHDRDTDRSIVSRHGRLVAHQVHGLNPAREADENDRDNIHITANAHEPATADTGTHNRKAHARAQLCETGSRGARVIVVCLFTASPSKSPDLRIRQATTRPPGQAQVAIIVPRERQPLCGTAKLRQSWHSFGPAAHSSDDTRWTAYCWR